jgi:hypothetical protein
VSSESMEVKREWEMAESHRTKAAVTRKKSGR